MAPRTAGNREMAGSTGSRPWGGDEVGPADRRLGGGGGGGRERRRRNEVGDDEEGFRRVMAEALGQALREAASIRSESIERRRRAAEEGDMEVAAEAYNKLCYDFPLVGKKELSALAIVLRKQLASHKKIPFPLTTQFASGVSYLVTSQGCTASRGLPPQTEAEGLTGSNPPLSEAREGARGQQEAEQENGGEDIRRLAQKVFMCVFVKLPAVCLSAWQKGDHGVLLQAFQKYHPPSDMPHAPFEEAEFSDDIDHQHHFKGSTKGKEVRLESQTEKANATSEDGGDGGPSPLSEVEAFHQLAEEEDDDEFEFEPIEESTLPNASGLGEASIARSVPDREPQRQAGLDKPASMTWQDAVFKLADLSSYVRYDAVDGAGLWEELSLMDDVLEILAGLQAVVTSATVADASESRKSELDFTQERETASSQSEKAVGDGDPDRSKLALAMTAFTSIFCNRLIAYPSSCDWRSGKVVMRFLGAMGATAKESSGSGINLHCMSKVGENANLEGKRLSLVMLSALTAGLADPASASMALSSPRLSSSQQLPAGSQSSGSASSTAGKASAFDDCGRNKSQRRCDGEKRLACLREMLLFVTEAIPFLATILSSLVMKKDVTSEWLSEVDALMQVLDSYVRWVPSYVDISQALLQTGIIRDAVQLFIKVGDGPPMEALRRFVILAAARSSSVGRYLAAIPTFRASTSSPAFVEPASLASVHGCLWPLVLGFVSIPSSPLLSSSMRNALTSGPSFMGKSRVKPSRPSVEAEVDVNRLENEMGATNAVKHVAALARMNITGDGGPVVLAVALGFLHRMLVLLQDIVSVLVPPQPAPSSGALSSASEKYCACLWKTGGPLDAAFAMCQTALSELAVSITAMTTESMGMGTVKSEPHAITDLTREMVNASEDQGHELGGDEKRKGKGCSSAETEHKEAAKEKICKLLPRVLRQLKEVRAVTRGESLTSVSRKSD